MIQIQSIIEETRMKYNNIRAFAGEPPVKSLSLQVEALAIVLVKAINDELKKKSDKPGVKRSPGEEDCAT